MQNVNNPRHKLNSLQIENAKRRYEDEGWKLQWISEFYKVHPSSILFHVRFNGWVRRVKSTRCMPDEIAELYREKKKKKYQEKLKGTYDYVRNMQPVKECEHLRWIKRCSCCGEILASDSIDHYPEKSNATRKLTAIL